MTFLANLPWRKESPARVTRHESDHPLFSFHREMNRLFDSFFSDMSMPGQSNGERPWSGFSPAVDVAETDSTFEINAEIPGIEADDVSLSVHNGILSINGELKREDEQEDKNYYRMERCFGSFQRAIPLPDSVDEDSVDASFKNGVLRVRFKKTEVENERVKRIEVKAR